MNHGQTELCPTVRRASPGDAAALARLINEAFRVESFFVDGDRTSEREVVAMLEHGDFLVIDRVEGGLAASVYIEVTRSRGHFGLLSIHPDHQGSGLGRRLVALAEALCEAKGCATMNLQVVNLRAELPPWYRSLGYRECGTAPFPAESKLPCHFIRMTKALD